MGAKQFLTTCVNAPSGEAIRAMVESARPITRRTFLRHVDPASMRDIERDLGYDSYLPMARDWHVSYHKGSYLGQPCVFFKWSAIEHIFV